MWLPSREIVLHPEGRAFAAAPDIRTSLTLHCRYADGFAIFPFFVFLPHPFILPPVALVRMVRGRWQRRQSLNKKNQVFVKKIHKVIDWFICMISIR